MYYLLIRRVVREAAVLNRILTMAKVVPVIVFVILALFYLDPQVFADNWSGGSDYGTLFDQVRATMLVTVFVFFGVEGASVYSRHAKRPEDVGRATVVGFVGVFATFGSVTIASYASCRIAHSPSCGSRRWPVCLKRRSDRGARYSSASA